MQEVGRTVLLLSESLLGYHFVSVVRAEAGASRSAGRADGITWAAWLHSAVLTGQSMIEPNHRKFLHSCVQPEGVLWSMNLCMISCFRKAAWASAQDAVAYHTGSGRSSL